MFCFFSEWLTMAKSSCGSGGLGGGLKEKLQEEFLSCKICLEPFSRPKALPCLHTFCEHCLTDYVRRNPGDKAGWFPCPMCRKDTPIPPGGVPEFQDNFVLLSLSQTLDEDTNWVPPAVQHQSQVTPPRPICPPSPKEKKLRSFAWVNVVSDTTFCTEVTSNTICTFSIISV